MLRGERGERVYLVECYLPGVRRDDVQSAADRIEHACADLRAAGTAVSYRGATFMAGDEVVLHLFGADAEDSVRDACQLAGVEHERILETVQVEAGASADAGADA